MGYSKQIVKGFSWAAFLNALAMFVSLGKIVILSRFVFGPAEFGVFGVGVLILGILELITETGINVFLVQEERPVSDYVDTAWVVSIIRGVLISFLLLLFSYPISIFFHITSYWTFILAFSLIPLLRGFINPGIASLQKTLKFRKDATYRFVISFVEDISILVLALITRSIFSFVLGMLLGVLVEIFVTFFIVKERPKLKFNGIHFKKIVDRGKWVTLAQIFDYLFKHTDDIIVGKVLNVFSLGIYQNSYVLSSLPENAVAQQLGKVTFPVFVNLKEDLPRVKRAFYRTFLTTFMVIMPFAFVLFFLSDPLIKTFLGAKWLAAIPVLKILAFLGVVRALVNLFYPVFLAFKKQNYITIVTLCSWVILGILIFPMTTTFGITGAALSALIGSTVGLPVCFYFLNKIFK